MPSDSQIKRQQAANAANNAATDAADAAMFSLDTLLARLEAPEASWQPPTIEKTDKPVRAKNSVPLLRWSEQVAAAAEALNPVFALPLHPPKTTPAGFTPKLVAAPRDLTKLGEKPARYLKRNAGSSLLLSQLIFGIYDTPAGPIAIPSLVEGQPLPLILLLTIMGKTGELYENTLYFQSLIGGQNSILKTLAERLNRYVYIDDAENIRASEFIV